MKLKLKKNELILIIVLTIIAIASIVTASLQNKKWNGPAVFSPADTGSLLTQVECSREIPKNVVKGNFINYESSFDEEKQMNLESFQLPNGIQTVVENSGCEYYTLKVSFEFPSEYKSEEVLRWYQLAVENLSMKKDSIDTPLSFENSVNALSLYAKNEDVLDYNVTLYANCVEGYCLENTNPEDFLADFIFIEEPQAVSQDKILLSIIFSKGPL